MFGGVCFAHRRSFRAFRARWLGVAVHLYGGKGLINGFFVVSLQLETAKIGCVRHNTQAAFGCSALTVTIFAVGNCENRMRSA